MTLCVAWIRQTREEQELVFATDSRLRAGEAWDTGIKLFDLGRRDCLLCFAGDTWRAYPIILHSNNLARFKIEWSHPRIDVLDVLDGLCGLFTDLCSTIADFADQDVHNLRSEARFLFGGWSWKKQSFGIWLIEYNQALEQFSYTAKHRADSVRNFCFLGDEDDPHGNNLEDEAARLLQADLQESGKLLEGTALDMEPLLVLARMARSISSYPSIGGSLQIAKVYSSTNNEFFGVLWPSAKGKPHVLGREVDPFDAPPVRLLDPDTAELVDRLPTVLGPLSPDHFGREADFVRKCYPEGRLLPDLPDIFRDRLQRLFHDQAYEEFVARLEAAGPELEEDVEPDSDESLNAEESGEDQETELGEDQKARKEPAPSEPAHEEATDLEETHDD